MGRPKKEVSEVKKVNADIVPVCPTCKSETVKLERKTIYKCLSCSNRFQ